MAIDVSIEHQEVEERLSLLTFGLRSAGYYVPDLQSPGIRGALFTHDVRLPNQAAVNAGLGRAPVAGAHNWIPTGPRNFVGRVRALAVHPSNERIAFAGAASGGIWKTVNRGETWFPLWHDEPSLAISAIAIHHRRADPDLETATIWVATGEPAANGRPVPGAGVFRSTNNGATFVQVATPATLNGSVQFEAIAVHPEDPDHCWVVGPQGIFRTLNGGGVWHTFEAGRPFSDVAFGRAAGGAPAPPHRFVVYLIRRDSGLGDIIRINNPVAADVGAGSITAQLADAANLAQPFAAGGAIPGCVTLKQPFTGITRARLAVCRDTPNVLFAVYTARGLGIVTQSPDAVFFAMYRTANANVRPSFSGAAWEVMPRANEDFCVEWQGSYNLTLAVSPVQENHVVFGMVNLFISTNAMAPLAAAPGPPVWRRSMAWDLFFVDRAHHADQHATAFEQNRAAPALWAGHDGGVSFNEDYRVAATVFFPDVVRPNPDPPPPPFTLFLRLPFAPPVPTHRWTVKSHGMAITQMYDLAQSPVVASQYGCGFQDLGVFFTGGGDGWRSILPGDGGFLTFDLNDPYHVFVTWLSGLADVTFPAANHEVIQPSNVDLATVSGVRVLNQGILPFDAAILDADAVIHPRKSQRLIYGRRGRLYGTTDGENWTKFDLGYVVQIVVIAGYALPGAPAAEGYLRVEVLPSLGAERLGLSRATAFGNQPTPIPGGQAYPAELITALQEPYGLVAGDTVDIDIVILDPATILARIPIHVVFAAADFADISHATAIEVARVIQRVANAAAAPGGPVPAGFGFQCFCQETFAIPPSSVELETRAAAAGTTLELRGTAVPLLGLTEGIYRTIAGFPAAVSLSTQDMSQQSIPFADVDLTGRDLRIRVGAGAFQAIDLTAATFADPAHPRADELAGAILPLLRADLDVTVVGGIRRPVLLTDNPTAFAIAGDALGPLGVDLFAGALPATSFEFNPLPNGVFNLTPDPAVGTPRRLTIAPGFAHAPFNVDFVAADFVSLQRATSEEVRRVIDAAVVAAGLVAADFRLVIPRPLGVGSPTEMAFSPVEPDTVWMGTLDGHVYRSTDDGTRWSDITDVRFLRRGRNVEAIAPHPVNKDIVYLGLYGQGLLAARDPGFLFRSINQGEAWNHIGSDVRDIHGNLLGINAIEIDPAAPDHVFVATDAGVFTSDDGGLRWRGFSEGLPNSPVMDLALAHQTRMLRCGVWGRGTFERHVGNAPAADRRIYVRSSLLDDGLHRPSPDGPDTFSFFQRAMRRTESPDIKNSPFRPPDIGTDEQIDFVEFDETIVHEEPVEGASNLFVQVHNRGSFPATAVRITAMWADASLGPPPLSDAFWTSYNAGGAPAVPAPWTLIGNVVLAGELVAGYPRAVALPVVWPASIGALDEIGILVIVSSPDDPLVPRENENNVDKLLTISAKAAYRVTETRRLADAREIHLVATSAAGFKVTPAGNAQARLGLATRGPADAPVQFQRSVGGVVGTAGAPGTFRLGGLGPPATVQIDDGTNRTLVEFRRPEIADLANATAAEIRRAINRQLRLGRVQVRAVVGRTDFAIAASSTDDGARPVALSATHLADLVVRVPAEPLATRAGLFELIARVAADRITRAVDNFFYVRVRNRGNAASGAARCRLYFLTFPVAAPAHVAEVVHAADIAAGDSIIEQIIWNSGPIPAADQFAVMLATVDHADRDPVVFPAAGFPNLEAVHDFCRTTNNAVYRVIPVS